MHSRVLVLIFMIITTFNLARQDRNLAATQKNSILICFFTLIALILPLPFRRAERSLQGEVLFIKGVIEIIFNL